MTASVNPELTPRRESAAPLLAATAHELRLPLSHIKGFVSSLRRTDVTWDQETRDDFLKEIEIETDRLAQLIDSLLLASSAKRTSVPTVDMKLISPDHVIYSALHRVRGLLGDRSLRVDAPRWLPAVRMDSAAIERVLANLLQNAIKYSPPGSPIGISARLTDGELELSVDDEGPGVPAEDRQRIFEPFVRMQTTGSGEGLGLAISLAIVLAHGGRMHVGDRPGGGARFTVLLPAQATVVRRSRGTRPHGPLHRRRLLIDREHSWRSG